MKKKVIDITVPGKNQPFEIPPRKLREENNNDTETAKKSAEISEEKAVLPEINTAEYPPFKKTPEKNTKVKVLTLIGLMLVLASVTSYVFLSKAKVEIWPETDQLSLKTEITVDQNQESPDFISKIIPGKIFEKDNVISQVFPASGTVEKNQKSEGIVKVYNEYSASQQFLLATTRFVSADGKLFRSPAKAAIPGSHYDKGKLVPGEVDVRVVADQPGPEYNIAPTTFSIPGFAGTDKYTKIYAKSFQTMSGGFSGELPQVTSEDMRQAEDSLAKRGQDETEALLKKDLQSGDVLSKFRFLESSIKTAVVDTTSSAETGSQAKDFNLQMKINSKTLVFNKGDMDSFVGQFIDSQIPEGKKLYAESLKVDFTQESADFNSGKMTLALTISAKAYSDINLDFLKNGVLGKSSAGAKTFLESQPGITKSQIKLWPFWVKSVPRDPKKTDLKLNID